MTVETKYKVGDKLYALTVSNSITGLIKVERINVTVTGKDTTVISYDTDKASRVMEAALFKTKQEVVDYWMMKQGLKV